MQTLFLSSHYLFISFTFFQITSLWFYNQGWNLIFPESMRTIILSFRMSLEYLLHSDMMWRNYMFNGWGLWFGKVKSAREAARVVRIRVSCEVSWSQASINTFVIPVFILFCILLAACSYSKDKHQTSTTREETGFGKTEIHLILEVASRRPNPHAFGKEGRSRRPAYLNRFAVSRRSTRRKAHVRRSSVVFTSCGLLLAAAPKHSQPAVAYDVSLQQVWFLCRALPKWTGPSPPSGDKESLAGRSECPGPRKAVERRV